jgi:transcriptional regulator with XRE-family HTH domain
MIKDKDYNEILNYIKNRRKEKGMSQNEISRELGISQVSYNNMENGKTSINLIRYFQLCEVLDINPFYLLRGVYEDPELETEKQLNKTFKSDVQKLRQAGNVLQYHTENLLPYLNQIQKEITDAEYQKIEKELNIINDIMGVVTFQIESLNTVISSEVRDELNRSSKITGNYKGTQAEIKDLRLNWPGNKK